MQRREFIKDANGRLAAPSLMPGSTTFYDAMGLNTGRSVTSNGSTIVYDRMGRQTGTIRGSR